MLSDRTRPNSIGAMIGNEHERLELVRWLKYWKIGTKPILLSGPPGVGKSTSVYAVARLFGYTVIEYNASDVRTRERLREALSPTLENASLIREEKLMIFLDEIDGLLGRSDYAGLDYVIDFIENSTCPLVMAANMEDTQKMRKIEQKSLVLRFRPIGEDLLFIYLNAVCEREGIEAPTDFVRKISKNSRGDVRQALNAMQTISNSKFASSNTDHQFMSDYTALDAIFKAETLDEALKLLRQFDAQPYEKIRAIFDSVVSAKNLPAESRSESLDLISTADMLLGQTGRKQSWRLLRYFDRYLALSIVGKKIIRSDSSIPWSLKLLIWNEGRMLKSISEQLSCTLHSGKSDVANLFLPYFIAYFKNRTREFEKFMERYEFGDSERRVLQKLARK